MAYRERLTAFYEKYNPAKVGSVDKTLEAYAGREEEMFEALVAKYGPEPPRATGSSNYKARLTAFYEKYNPAKVGSVDKTLEAYAGREEEMFEALVAKYGPEPGAAPPAGAGGNFKARLTAFYEKYNPAKVGSVDKTLEAYAGREEEMFEALVAKYGPEPAGASAASPMNSPASPTSPSRATGVSDYKARLTAFYEKYNPAKVGSVDKTLEAYAGREEEMFEALVAKYGPEPGAGTPAAAPASPAAPASAGGNFKARLTAFYEKYNPGKVGSVDKTLEAYAGREEEMFEALVAKYGPEPGAASPSAAASAPAAPSGGGDFKTRLTAFYEKYNPAKVGSVDKTLEAYAGREEEMFEALVAKYGPEPAGAAAASSSASPPAKTSTPPSAQTSSSTGNYKARLTAFYEKYNPAKFGSVDKTLEAYAGREEEMFEALVGKYGPEPGAASSTSASPASGGNFKARLTAFYEKYNPAKVGSVDKTLEAYAGREEEMFEALVAKYGPEPAGAAPPAAAATPPSSGGSNFKARLTAFYEKYNPAKVGSVDKTLEAYAGREEEMFEALVAKYGPEPAGASHAVSPSAPAAAPAGSDFKARLTAFYEKYNPAKVGSVDKTLEAYAGREEEMFEALVAKYGPEPGAASPSAAPSGGSDYKARLTAFYEKYNPAKVGSVDKTLEAYAGREEEMFEALVAKYGPEPAGASPAVSPSAPAAAPAGGNYKARLTAFYEKYNPAKVGSVDKTLEAYAGREEEMFEALVAKYGPEPGVGAPAGAGGNYKARLTAFYEKYNPAKVGSVDKTLEAYAGREEEMFEALVAKYGPEPGTGTVPPPPVKGDYKTRLTAFYEKYNPAKVGSVDKTLEAYAGREEEMFEALVTKYGPEPAGASPAVSPSAPAAPSAGGDYKARLTAFYEKYNPAKVGSVDKTLEAYAGREEEMFEALVAKYGPEPAAPTPSAGGDYRARLTAFYEKYNPAKVKSVDKALETYAGREEEMFEALVAKYGPEPVVSAKDQPLGGAGNASYANRLAAFYEKYVPSKVASVAGTLSKYEGREEELFEALVAKYGPEPTNEAAAPASVTSRQLEPEMEVPTKGERQDAEKPAEIVGRGEEEPKKEEEPHAEAAQSSAVPEGSPEASKDEDPAEDRLRQLMKEEGVADDDHTQIRLLKRLIAAEQSGPKVEAYGSPSSKDRKHHKKEELSAEERRALMEKDEQDTRQAIEDLAFDEIAIEGHHFNTSKNKTLTREHVTRFLASNVTALTQRYFENWQSGAKALRKAKRQAAVASMTNYQKMQLTPSAKQYYSRMEEMDRQQQVKQELQRRKEQEERDARIRQAFSRGDFVTRNKEEASLSPQRIKKSPGSKQGSPLGGGAFGSPNNNKQSPNTSKSNRSIGGGSSAALKRHSSVRELDNKKQRERKEKEDTRQRLGNNFAQMPQSRQIAILRQLKKRNLPIPFDLQEALDKSAALNGENPNDNLLSSAYSDERFNQEQSRAEGLFASPIHRLGGGSSAGNSPKQYNSPPAGREALQWPQPGSPDHQELEAYMQAVLAEADAEQQQ